MALLPINDLVLLQEKEAPKTTASGIILDYAQSAGDISLFNVLDVGPDVNNISEGDVALINITKAFTFSYQGKKQFLIKEEDILAVEG